MSARTIRPGVTDRHLTVPELADRLGISVKGVYMLNYNGTGPPYIKIGRSIRFRLADIEKWESARTVTRERW